MDEEKKITYNFVSSAGGKVIISGEHSVVYGKPAIAFSIDKKTTMELKGYKSTPSSNDFAVVNLDDLKMKTTITKSELIDYINNKIVLDYKNENKYKSHLIHVIKIICDKIMKFDIAKIEIIITYINNNYFEASFTSEIPVGFGLGSSAAYNICIVNGICNLINNLYGGGPFKDEEILELANEGEKIFHNGTPSGIDVSCSLKGGIINFKNIKEQKNINISDNNFFMKRIQFLLINSNIKRNGGEFIKIVSDFKKHNLPIFNQTINDIETVTNNIINLLSKENSDENDCIKFFELIKENQKLLKKICVSNDKIDEIINLLENNNFVGKISGAGGGGFIISFCIKEKYDDLIKLLNENELEYINVNISEGRAKMTSLKLENIT